MDNKIILRYCMALWVIITFPAVVQAGKANTDICAATDTICVDTLNLVLNVRQIPLSEYDRIEQTISKKYAIVYKDSLCGIYDIEGGQNVTELEYSTLRVRNRAVTDVGGITVFVFTCEDRKGLISICEVNNENVIIEF